MKECAVNPHARDLHSSRAKGTRRYFFSAMHSDN